VSKSRYQIVVIGGGLAGSLAAIKAADLGADVTLISNYEPFRSASALCRNGINSIVSKDDTVDLHIEDTLNVSSALANRDIVHDMCSASPYILELVDRMGAALDRTKEGMLCGNHFPGSSVPRTISVGNITGRALSALLYGQICRMSSIGRIDPMFGWEFLSPILKDDGSIAGVVTMNLMNMNVRAVQADAVILCSGGYQSIYSFSSGPSSCDGSAGIACYKVGAEFANPEFVMFHPYALDFSGRGVIIPYSSDFSKLHAFVNRDGKRIPIIEDLPIEKNRISDIAKSVQGIMDERTETGDKPDVYLDVSELQGDLLDSDISNIFDACFEESNESPVPVVRVKPAAYMSLGGLHIDRSHATNISGLFAAGDAASGYHGAEVLPGNELLSAIFGGIEAGKFAFEYVAGNSSLKGKSPSSLLERAVTIEEDFNSSLIGNDGHENAAEIEKNLGLLLSSFVGVVRRGHDLEFAQNSVDELSEKFESAYLIDKSEWANKELIRMRRLKQRLELARLIVVAAHNRRESRGCHFRADFAERDDDRWNTVTVAEYSDVGPKLKYD